MDFKYDPSQRGSTFPLIDESLSSSTASEAKSRLTADEVDKLLLSSKKIKNRSRKACYPCNRRKIKCNREQCNPCTNCVKHNHPELCSWTADGDDAKLKRVAGTRRTYQEHKEGSLEQGSTSSQAGNAAYPTPTGPPSHDSRASKQLRTGREPTLENVVHNYRSPSDLRGSSAAPSPRTPNLPADIPNRSIASLVQDRASNTPLVGVPSMLGIENQTASYLFIKAADAPERWRQLLSMQPSEKEVFKFFGFFKSLSLPFNPILVDPDEFETAICRYVEELGNPVPSRYENDKAISWMGLLLAVLSCGAQLSNLPLEDRTKLSRDYARKSFHCLRLANFLMRPSEEVVQALLLLVQVLQNDLQAFSGWSLLGTTIRLAQSLGPDIRLRKEEERAELRIRYRKLWRAVLWSDAVLSLCLGRPPSAIYRGSIAIPPWDENNLCYFDSMFCLCDVVMRVIDPARPENLNIDHVRKDIKDIESIFSQAAPHLQDKEKCRSLRDRMEYYGLQLSVSCTKSYICQMALRRVGDDGGAAPDILITCKQSLIATVKAFLSLTSLSINTIRGWSYIHHALSCALLLGLMGETRTNPEVKAIQESLISVLSAADGDSDTGSAATAAKDGSTRFTNRHAKALEALQAMCSQAQSGATTPPEHEPPNNEEELPQANLTQQMDSFGNLQWNMNQAELFSTPNGTILNPGTFWDALFADSTISADPGVNFHLQQQDSWGL